MMGERQIYQGRSPSTSLRSKTLSRSDSDFGSMHNYRSYSLLKRKTLKSTSAMGSLKEPRNEVNRMTTLLIGRKTIFKKPFLENNPQLFRISRLSLPLSNQNKQTTISELLHSTSRLIKNIYSKSASEEEQVQGQVQGQTEGHVKVQEFNNCFKKYILSLLQSNQFKVAHQRKITEHLNLIFYSSPTFKNKKFREIEQAILSLWPENTVLKCIHRMWYQHLQQHLEAFGPSALTFLKERLMEDFKDLMAALTYLSFQGFFTVLVGGNDQGREWVHQRLRHSTSVLMISQGGSWDKLYCHMVVPLLLKNQYFIPIEKLQSINFSLNLCQRLKKLEDRLENELTPLPSTCCSMEEFTQEHSLDQKLQKMIGIRRTMEKELLQYQEELISHGQQPGYIMMDKDDILSCIILCVLQVNHKVNFYYQLKLALEELDIVLGTSKQSLLAVRKCSSYEADLRAALEYIEGVARGSF